MQTRHIIKSDFMDLIRAQRRRRLIGKAYALRAKPGKDEIFAGWEGVNATGPAITFVMRAGLEVTARFVRSFAVPFAG